VSTVPDVSYDAVVVVPGLMGSRLVETETDTELWGFTTMLKYSWLWLGSGPYAKLAVTPQERAGQVGRVTATNALTSPAALPVLRGFEPYTRLLKRARESVVKPGAVCEFAYDWRLPVEHNARLLAKAAREHLDRWRADEVHKGREAPRLVIAAHSMGGLLTRALAVVQGEGDTPVVTPDIRAAVTLGTPFRGSVKSAHLLSSGGGAPRFLHEKRLREVARTMPGVYDVLPRYRCVEDVSKVRTLTPADVARIGGDEELAQAAADFFDRVRDESIPGHRLVIGTRQRTWQSLVLKDGLVVPSSEYFEWDGDEPKLGPDNRPVRRARDGDGTVARDAAVVDGVTAQYLPQQHGALAKSAEGVDGTAAVITEIELGAPMGVTPAGVDVPDVVEAGETWAIEITGLDKPTDAGCEVYDAGAPGKLVDMPPVQRAGDRLEARLSVDAPGVYRVEVSAGGASPVSQLVLAVEPDAGA
jgi:pimeloyl-ACP methyl ester carboxylesterase